MPHRQLGLTLVEQMVVVTLIGVLAALAVPNLNAFVVNNRLHGSAKDFLTVLNMARGEAVLRGAPVVLRRTGPTAQNWSGGWELFVDVDGDGQRDTAPDSPELLLRSGLAMSPPLTLYGSSAAADGIRFLPNGRASALGSGNALFMLCYDGQPVANGQSRARAILVSDSGRIRMAAANDSGYPVNDLAVAITSCTNPA